MGTALERCEDAQEKRVRAEAESIDAVIDAHAAGYSIAVISRAVGWSRTTIYKIVEEKA